MNKNWDIIKAEYLTTAVRPDQYPKGILPEIAFIGRSNVGKSSLINSLCRQNKLARISSTPGKTQTINFYQLEAKAVVENEQHRTNFMLVDLPGYGYAKASRDSKQLWSGFIKTYLQNASNLTLVCQLIDIRHGLMESDLDCYNWLQSIGRDVQVVLTKSDKISKQMISMQKEKLSAALGAVAEDVITYSSSNHSGRAELINDIVRKGL